MKKTTQIDRFSVLFTIIIILSFAFISCDKPSGVRQNKEGYTIVLIDSCEYIEVSSMMGTNAAYYSLTHKGNCKFCLARNNHSFKKNNSNKKNK